MVLAVLVGLLRLAGWGVTAKLELARVFEAAEPGENGYWPTRN